MESNNNDQANTNIITNIKKSADRTLADSAPKILTMSQGLVIKPANNTLNLNNSNNSENATNQDIKNQ